MDPSGLPGPIPPWPANDTCALTDEIAEPEGRLLRAVFHEAPFVARLARAPGGWRTLSEHELDLLRLTHEEKSRVLALQALVGRSYPELPKWKFPGPEAIGRVYGRRLGGLTHEILLALALDGRNNFLAEVEIATGGAHSLVLQPADVIRPVLRTGASRFILLHNHPSGDPMPSAEDITLTRRLAGCAEDLGLSLCDHLIIGGRGGGYVSLVALGLHSSRA